MDWSQLAPIVGAVAPTLGGLLGSAFGPAGGIVGGVVGRAIGAALGVPATPEAISEALAKDKNAVEKLRILEATKATAIVEDARVEVERLRQNARQAESIGVTQRAEIAAGVSWWHWRHLLGYVPVIIGTEVAALLPLVVIGKITAADMGAIIGAITPFLAIISGLLGYVASDTTSRINTAITGEHSAGGLMNTLRGMLPRKPA